MAEDIVEETLDAAYQLFTPKAGGIVDRHRKETARREAAAEEQRNINERVEERSYRAVKVSPLMPEVISPYTFLIPAGASEQILPASPYRSRITIVVPTVGGVAWLTKDAGSALTVLIAGGIGPCPGYPLAQLNGALPFYTRGQMWAVNVGGTAIQVSVLPEIYAPES